MRPKVRGMKANSTTHTDKQIESKPYVSADADGGYILGNAAVKDEYDGCDQHKRKLKHEKASNGQRGTGTCG